MVGPSSFRVIAGIFILPVVILILHLFLQDISLVPKSFDAPEIMWALRNSLYLGAGSAVFSLVLGFIFSFGLQACASTHPRLAGVLRQALLFPIYLPPFFIILIFFYWFDFFPLGKLANIVAQTLTYAGMTAVLWTAILQENLADLSQMARVQGISKFRFLWMSRQLLYRPVVALGVFIFAISFSSFSIPLILSGGRGTTLEILIYEKIRISQDFGLALWMAAAQSLFLGALFWNYPGHFTIFKGRGDSRSYFSSKLAAVLMMGFLVFQFFPWIAQSPAEWSQAWNQISEAPDFWNELLETGRKSLFLSLMMMMIMGTLALYLVFLMVQSPLPKYLRSYFALSVSVVGLSGILILDFVGPNIAYLFSFTVLMFFSIFRLTIDPKIGALESQLQVAKVLGASQWQRFREIAYPQIRHEYATLLGMTFLWTLGDFAVARFFLPAGSTITLLIESLMTSYRIQGAILLGLFVLLVGGLMQILLWRVFDVDPSES